MGTSIWRGCVAAVLLACVAASPRVAAHGGVFLNVPTIKGTESQRGFAGWIDLNSYSVGVRAGKNALGPAVSVLQFTKSVDSTSPLFADAYFRNKPFAGSTKLDAVSVISNTATATFEIQVHNAFVVADSAAAGGTGANETIQLAYDAIQYCAIPSTGPPVCKAWNLKTNTPVYPADKK